MESEVQESASADRTPRHDASMPRRYFHFHVPHAHLGPVFGGDRFGQQAEAFARFFGTPRFLIAQTVLVGAWIALNVVGLTAFDPYPFILLNLAFSTQAAYAAPLILLAQTRQADRERAHAIADAQHREAIAEATVEWQRLASDNAARMLELLEQNTRLTELSRELNERIEKLTAEVHRTVVRV